MKTHMDQEELRHQQQQHEEGKVAYMFMATLDALERRDRECLTTHLKALGKLATDLKLGATGMQIGSAESTTKDEFDWDVIRTRLFVAWETALLEIMGCF